MPSSLIITALLGIFSSRHVFSFVFVFVFNSSLHEELELERNISVEQKHLPHSLRSVAILNTDWALGNPVELDHFLL